MNCKIFKQITAFVVGVFAVAGIATAQFASASGVVNVSTLAELNNAINDNKSIKLTANITVSSKVVIPAGKTITLDLNGYTFAVDNPGAKMSIENLGDLTISDSSDAGDGLIKSRIIDSYGKLTLTSGKIESAGLGGGAGIWNNPGGEVIITGGILKVSGTEASKKAPISLVNEGKATITGGTFIAPFTNVSNSGELEMSNVALSVTTADWMAFKDNGGKSTLNNVTITAKKGGCVNADLATSVVNLNNVTCTQEEFVNWNSTLIAASNGGTVNVFGGTYTSLNEDKGFGLYVFSTGGTINLHDGAVKAPVAIQTDKDSANVNIKGGDLEGDITLKDDDNLKITGGTFDGPKTALDLVKQILEEASAEFYTNDEGKVVFGTKPVAPAEPATPIEEPTQPTAPATQRPVRVAYNTVVAGQTTTETTLEVAEETHNVVEPTVEDDFETTNDLSTLKTDDEAEKTDEKTSFNWIPIAVAAVVVVLGVVVAVVKK